MKHELPAELDQLMWTVAESEDEAAIEEFGVRYPDHRPELGRRIGMIRDLRGLRPDPAFRNTPPRFVPAAPSAGLALPRWAYGLVPILLAGVAWGSYSVATRYSQRPAPTPEPTAIGTRSDGFPDPIPLDRDLPAPPLHREGALGSQPPRGRLAPYEMPMGIRFERVALVEAIQAIGAQSTLRIEIAPGFESFDVSMRYSGMKPMDILRDLGRNFGFTVFEQEPGHVLLIPEVDPAKQEGDPIEPIHPDPKHAQPEAAKDKPAADSKTPPAEPGRKPGSGGGSAGAGNLAPK